jgi:hypothetical protein
MNTLLIGEAELIDPVQPQVRKMLENEGVYIAGDANAPAMTVVLAVQDGKVFSMQLDKELNPERFVSTLTAHGPYHAERFSRIAETYANLEGLRDALLTPREIVRDDDGYLTHPALPLCDEDVTADRLLAAFGLETRFVSMESDHDNEQDIIDAHETGGCTKWTPTQPVGEGWVLLEIYDTEDGPYAMFARRLPTESVRQQLDREAKEADRIEAIMTQAQVFASALAMVGGKFDAGDALATAEREKGALRDMLIGGAA